MCVCEKVRDRKIVRKLGRSSEKKETGVVRQRQRKEGREILIDRYTYELDSINLVCNFNFLIHIFFSSLASIRQLHVRRYQYNRTLFLLGVRT